MSSPISTSSSSSFDAEFGPINNAIRDNRVNLTDANEVEAIKKAITTVSQQVLSGANSAQLSQAKGAIESLKQILLERDEGEPQIEGQQNIAYQAEPGSGLSNKRELLRQVTHTLELFRAKERSGSIEMQNSAVYHENALVEGLRLLNERQGELSKFTDALQAYARTYANDQLNAAINSDPTPLNQRLDRPYFLFRKSASVPDFGNYNVFVVSLKYPNTTELRNHLIFYDTQAKEWYISGPPQQNVENPPGGAGIRERDPIPGQAGMFVQNDQPYASLQELIASRYPRSIAVQTPNNKAIKTYVNAYVAKFI